MQICCPSCGYRREMPDNRLPEGTVVATCPQCHARFRFSKERGVLDGGTDEWSAGHRDAGDAPPPGAVIPGRAPFQGEAETGSRPGAPAQSEERLDEPDPARPEQARHERQAPAARPRGDGLSHISSDGRNRYVRKDESPQPGEEPLAEEPLDEAEGADGQEALDGDSDDGRDEGQGRPSFNPWEYAPYPDGWPSAFYQTCMRVMLAPTRFFADLRPAPGMRSLVFYLLICVLQIVVERVWSLAFLAFFEPNASTDPQMQKVVELLASQGNIALTLLLRCGFLTLQLYLFSALLTFIWRFVAPGRADFSVVFQVLAYAEAPGILCLVPAVGTVAGIIWGLVVMFVGCRAAMRLTWGQTIMGFVPLILLILPSLLQLSQMFGPG